MSIRTEGGQRPAIQTYLSNDEDPRLPRQLDIGANLYRSHGYHGSPSQSTGSTLLSAGDHTRDSMVQDLAALTSASSLESTASLSSSVGDALIVNSPQRTRVLECPFDLLYCSKNFAETNYEEWVLHSLTHFSYVDPPTSNRCCFCEAVFDSHNGLSSWHARMRHVFLHHRLGHSLSGSQPDFPLYTYLWNKHVISDADYRDIKENSWALRLPTFRRAAIAVASAATEYSASECIHSALDIVQSRIMRKFAWQDPLDVRLDMLWDIRTFMTSQYGKDNDDADLGSVIVLNGSALCAEATTCSEYVRRTWPSHGVAILALFNKAIEDVPHEAKEHNDFFSLDIRLLEGLCAIRLYSKSLVIVSDILGQAIWLGAALRVSDNGSIQYSSPVIRSDPQKLEVTYKLKALSRNEQSCWVPLFNDPVIAQGYPVPKRDQMALGLEVPLQIMAVLIGARHITSYDSRWILKGYSSMLIPVKQSKDFVQWHLLLGNGRSRMTYKELNEHSLDPDVSKEIELESLQSKRAFLGWWKTSVTQLGTTDGAYESIDWSPAMEARRSTRFLGGEIGFQSIGAGKLSFSVGAKDGRLHLVLGQPFRRVIECAKKTPVALYDLEDRRAWLVTALDVMLHIILLRHRSTQNCVQGKTMELVYACRGLSAEDAVLENKAQLLFKGDTPNEKDFYFKDAILDVWSQMERLKEKDDMIESTPGLALHGTMRHALRGWEFMSLVDEKNYRLKTADIAKSSGGWVDLVDDVDSLVLFANGLKEVITPIATVGRLCDRWKTLPLGKDYLAANVSILEILYAEAGSRISRKHLSSSHLQWHNGSHLFEDCSVAASGGCTCIRLQQIYHDSLFKTFGQVRSPGKLEPNGCVIFGQDRHPIRLVQTEAPRENSVHMLPNIPFKTRRSPSPTLPLGQRLYTSTDNRAESEPCDGAGDPRYGISHLNGLLSDSSAGKPESDTCHRFYDLPSGSRIVQENHRIRGNMESQPLTLRERVQSSQPF